jgi:hypothetical protein
VIEEDAYKQLSYFWFPMRGRVLTNIWQMKWFPPKKTLGAFERFERCER